MNHNLLAAIASQVVQRIGVSITPRSHLATKVFTHGNQKLVAIEQNPNTRSRWASLAKQGRQVVQFKDTSNDEYVAVSVDGKITEYQHGQKPST